MNDYGHLVLGRHLGEGITIDVPPSDTPTRIVIEVEQLKGVAAYGGASKPKVKLGARAPKHVEINRNEVLARMQATEGEQ